MAAEPAIAIEVVHARPGKQVLLSLKVMPGTTLAQAIEQSGIREHFPDLVVEEGLVGIFSRKAALDNVVKAGDRIEIYRPLIADPKEVRRERARNAGS